MSLFKIIEDHNNFVLFENIDGNLFFYELLMRTIQRYNPETADFLTQLRDLEIPTLFDYDKEFVTKDIGLKIDALIISLYFNECNS